MEDSEPKKAPGPKRKWARWAVLGFALVLAVFHRPLILAGVRWAVIEYAGQRHLGLDFKLGGGLYSDLRLEGIRAKATGPSAIQEMEAGTVEIAYSIPELLRKGPRELVRSVAANQLRLVVDPSMAPPQERFEPFKVPALLPKQVEIRGAEVAIRTPKGNLEIDNGSLTLFPDRPGMLGIDRLKIPFGQGEYRGLAATTTYSAPRRAGASERHRDWHLILHDLGVGPEVEIGELNFDLSTLEHGVLGVTMRANLFHGKTNLTATITKEAHVAHADVKLSGAGVSLESAGRFFGLEGIGGTVGGFKARVSGEVDRPASWEGVVSMEGRELKNGDAAVDRVRASVELKEGIARLIGTQIWRGAASMAVRGLAELPQRGKKLEKASGHYELRVPQLAEVGAWVPSLAKSGTFTGEFTAEGDFQLGKGRLSTGLKASGSGVGMGATRSETLALQANAAVPFPPPEPAPGQASLAAFVKGIDGRVAAQLGVVEAGQYRVDSAEAKLSIKEGRMELEQAVARRAENRVELSGAYWIPEDPKRFAEGRLEADIDLSAPALAAIAPELGGSLAMRGFVRLEKRVLAGDLSLSGSGVRLEQFAAQSLAGRIAITENRAAVKELRVNFSDGDFAMATGEILLEGKYPYHGRMDAKIRDLAVFQPVLKAMGRSEPVAGGLELSWSGTGGVGSVAGEDSNDFGHSGMIDLSLRNGKFGKLEKLEAAVSGTYSQESIQLPQCRLSSSMGSVELGLYYSKQLLGMQNLTVRQGGLVVMAGNAFIPLNLAHWSDPASRIPAEGELVVDMFSPALDLKGASAAIGRSLPASGRITATLKARGKMAELKADLQLQGRDLKVDAVPQLAPAKLDLALNLSGNRLALKAAVAQPDIKPLTVNGELPLDLSKVIGQGKLDENAPIKLRAVMEKSSLGFLSKAVPEIRYAEGEMSLDARAGGSLRQPAFAGAALFNLLALRFQKPTLPSIANFQGHLVFIKNKLAIDRLQGEIGGGPFEVTGNLSWPEPKPEQPAFSLMRLGSPELDLRATSKNLLVQRNNALTIRANADLAIKGPVKSGTVSGTVGLTNSRFFREVEILPIGLPGRPARRAPRMNPQIVLPQFLDEWSFDVKVKTDDPFQVRSNLARGEGTVDLAFKGTGPKAGLGGQVAIENLAAALPFSKLNVDYGYLYFTPSVGLDPALDIHGVSELRDYHIDIYIHGTAQDPQSTLTSDPPLPQEDIVALLATGATVKEIGGSPDVLAGRAAVLLFDKIYRKIFKKNAPGTDESVPSRLQFDLGGVNATTGKQEVNTQFKLSDNFYLIGEVGLDGGVGGKVKYVLRFR